MTSLDVSPLTRSPRHTSGCAERVPSAPSPSGEDRVRIIAELDELRSLETAHQTLFASAATPHVGTSYPYVIAEATTASPEQPWRVFAAYRNGALAGCLYGRRLTRTVVRMRMPVFELGAKFVADPLLGPTDPHPTLRSLIETLVESERDCAMFVFPRLSAASFEQLARAATELGLPWDCQWAPYAYAFDTTIGVDEFVARMDGRQRRELSRRNRRLVRDHACGLRREEGLALEDDLARFETFMRIEDSGWKGANGTSIRRRAGYEPFFRELIRSASLGRQLVWYTLHADERPIAMYLAMHTHDTLWLPKIGYDESFAVHAPGMVLGHNVLLECVANPAVRRADNISATPWVRLWKPSIVSFRSMTLFSKNARSSFVYRTLAAERFARRVVGRPKIGPGPGDRPYL